jgi:hypothetical protein
VLAIVRSTVGERRIDTVTANDVRSWFKNWGRADEDGELANPRRAYWCLQMLRIAVKYGKGLRNAACRELSEILTDTEFPAPRGRRQAMSVEQAAESSPRPMSSACRTSPAPSQCSSAALCARKTS